MAPKQLYRPEYGTSHAVVVGINTYKHEGPLAFAVNDAEEVAKTLSEQFGFDPANIACLQDKNATRAAIMSAFMKLTKGHVQPDDRVVFFFAGHGHTEDGLRQTGFLIPQDGTVDDLSTLIRWDELTRNADLIPAKHILFLMDACYGGLAVHRRGARAGSSRFLSDILQRRARQVLAAGKPDQVVSDGGGTRKDHSIFTAHLLDGMEGAAAMANGLITANALMKYVYEKVGTDPYSQQTPHYGAFDGDGDFIFNPNVVAPVTPPADDKEGNEILVEIPDLPEAEPSAEQTLGEAVKELIPVPASRIKLDTLVDKKLREALAAIDVINFPVQQPANGQPEGFAARVKRYDQVMADLEIVAALLAHYGEPQHSQLLTKLMTRLAEAARPMGGLVALLHLTAYPVLAVMYAAGIGALAANRYDMLHAALLTPVRWSRLQRSEPFPIVVPIAMEVTDIFNNFKQLPGLENKYLPRSEHMLTALQPIIEDELFLGRSYEDLFDQFEIMLALVYADVGKSFSAFWGPPGRFSYLERSVMASSKPLTAFVENVRQQGQAWPGFAAGFFNGSLDRFNEIANGFAALLAKAGPVF